MADMHHRIACLAERGDQSGGVVGGGVGTGQRPLALGEVVVLDIDYDERLLGHGCVLDGLAGSGVSIGAGQDSRIGRTDNRQGKTDNGRRKGRHR